MDGNPTSVTQDFHVHIPAQPPPPINSKRRHIHQRIKCFQLMREVKVHGYTTDILSTHHNNENADILWTYVLQKNSTGPG